MKRLLVISILVLLPAGIAAAEREVVIGSKKDVEGNILAEVMAQLLENRGFPVERRPSLSNTLLCFEALRTHAIDLYPEYSGTIEQEILKLPGRASYEELRQQLQQRFALDLLDPFGFQNTYAIAVRRAFAEEHRLKTIGDLARVPDLRYGFSHEFLERKDGWPGLARAYRLGGKPSGIAHGLAYEALHDGKIDVTDVYSTDGDIKKFDLVLLEDDRHYFPQYLAAPLVRHDLDPGAKAVLGELAGRISEGEMQDLNGRALLEQKNFAEIARQFLQDKGLLQGEGGIATPAEWRYLLSLVATHVQLTFVAVFAAMAVAIPLGVLVYRLGAVSRPVVYFVGILQTIPSIALLAFMIPLLGIGPRPAIVALFLYALLPILRNTVTALFSVDPILRKVAVGMGLTPWQQLRYVELPLAAPTILAGIKTAAVITIGTATLAAWIGAGGLGQLIVTGLEVKNYTMVVKGALLAAALAVLTEIAFEWLEKVLIPKHLLQTVAE
jgi:osmoprotectant transport system permease protein